MKYIDQQPGVFSLNRGWKFTKTSEIVTAGGSSHRELYASAKGDGAAGPAAVSFDDTKWQDIALPHDWIVGEEFNEKALTGPSHGYRDGDKAWYRLHFALDPEDKGKQILLDFEGMSREARVYINGSLVYVNQSGYHPFTVDITDMAIFDIRGNMLAIAMDTTTGAEGWWYEGAGIYRSAWLIKKNRFHIAEDGIYVRSEVQEDGSWKTTVTVEAENSLEGAQEATLRLTLKDPDGKAVMTSEKPVQAEGYTTSEVTFETVLNEVQLWGLEHPVRYRAEVELIQNGEAVDYLKTYYGYRTIRFDADTGFYLNGENMKLKGFCNHQDHAGVGVAVPYSVKEWRIKKLLEIGANAYRCSHNTDPEIQEICDRLGMMVMEENRNYRTSDETIRNLRNMVRKARNHPSVILYSIFNEEPLQGTEQGARLTRRLREEIRKLDDQRPTTGAMNGGYMEEQGSGTVLDVTGINYHTSAYDEFHEKYPDQPVIGSETVSAFMVRGESETDPSRNTVSNYDVDCAPWGNTVRDGWKQIGTRPFMGGTFVWTGFDYRGEPTPYTWPSVSTFFGTFDTCGFEKDCCYLYRAYWTKEPMMHVLPDLDQPIDTGKLTKFMTFTNCEEAEIFINGKSMGRKTVDPYDMAEWEYPYEMGTLKAVGYIGGEIVAEDEKKTPGAVAALRMELSKDTMNWDNEDAILVNVTAVDAMGNEVPSADTLVFFETEGGAKVIGVGNGDPNSHESEVTPYRHMFHGHIQAVIKNCDGADVVVRAYAEHVESAEMKITTQQVPVFPDIKVVNDEVITGWTMHKDVFDEHPDPNPEVSDQDMNTFEPVSFEFPQAVFSQPGYFYGLYRTEHDFGAAEAGRAVYCSMFVGQMEFYIDGELIGASSQRVLQAELPAELSGKHVVTIVLRKERPNYPMGGILKPIVIKHP